MRYATPKKEEMFKINKDVPIESNVRDVLSYTIAGKEEYLDTFSYPRIQHENSQLVHAKCVHVGNSVRYFVKITSTGRIFNPIGMYDESQRLRESRHAGKPNWTWRQTTEEVFMLYLEFLKTKNPAHLLNAERKIL
jgi:hypothetical protein